MVAFPSTRRAWLGLCAALASSARGAGAGAPPAPADDPGPALGVHPRALRFPADHAAHPDTHVEWWYVTGWLQAGPGEADPARRPDFGFQLTFFRSRTDLAADSPSRFAARQLVFAHLALTDLTTGGGSGRPVLEHDQRVAREAFGLARTPRPREWPQVVSLGDWSLVRTTGASGASGAASEGSALSLAAASEGFSLALDLRGSQPLLLQGEAGYSRKGPGPAEASHYYSEPQLVVRGRLARPTSHPREVVGRAWLDHEWSNAYLSPEAVGWDWIGFNLGDGGALTAFRLRRADGTALWSGGSWRPAGQAARIFAPAELEFVPRRWWTSPRTGVRYPVQWRVGTPVGEFTVAALADDQELDSRASTGSLYWEGLSSLAAADGRPLGWGYLELTGYGERLRM